MEDPIEQNVQPVDKPQPQGQETQPAQESQPIDPVNTPTSPKIPTMLIVLAVILLVLIIGVIVAITGVTKRGNPNKAQPTMPLSVSPTPVATSTPTATPANLNNYTSAKLGITFARPDVAQGSMFYVGENGSKICVSYNQNDQNCEAGQSIEVFKKEQNQTLSDAITKQFLVGKSQDQCWVESYKVDLPSNYTAAEIVFSMTDVNTGNIDEKSANCSAGYARTNGVRYFLEDINHPTKFLFLNLGQAPILSIGGIPWQETIKVLN